MLRASRKDRLPDGNYIFVLLEGGSVPRLACLPLIFNPSLFNFSAKATRDFLDVKSREDVS